VLASCLGRSLCPSHHPCHSNYITCQHPGKREEMEEKTGGGRRWGRREETTEEGGYRGEGDKRGDRREGGNREGDGRREESGEKEKERRGWDRGGVYNAVKMREDVN